MLQIFLSSIINLLVQLIKLIKNHQIFDDIPSFVTNQFPTKLSKAVFSQIPLFTWRT